MKTIVYCKCGAKSTPRKWRDAGWLKSEIRYVNGSRLVSYTCSDCRDRNIAAWEAEKGLSAPPRVAGMEENLK